MTAARSLRGKPGARERLLDACSPEKIVRAFQRGESFATLRKRIAYRLRMHERELAERVRVALVATEKRGFAEMHAAAIAAIIGPQRKARGKR